jgi:hypothetical protein
LKKMTVVETLTGKVQVTAAVVGGVMETHHK